MCRAERGDNLATAGGDSQGDGLSCLRHRRSEQLAAHGLSIAQRADPAVTAKQLGKIAGVLQAGPPGNLTHAEVAVLQQFLRLVDTQALQIRLAGGSGHIHHGHVGYIKHTGITAHGVVLFNLGVHVPRIAAGDNLKLPLMS